MDTVADVIVTVLERFGVRRLHAQADESLQPLRVAASRAGMVWRAAQTLEAVTLEAYADAATAASLSACVTTSDDVFSQLTERSGSRVPLIVIVVDRAVLDRPAQCAFADYRRIRNSGGYIARSKSATDVADELHAAALAAVEDRAIAMLMVDGADLLLPARAVPTPIKSHPFHQWVPSLSTRALDEAADALNRAESVTILAGPDVAGAHDLVVALAGVLQAPIAHVLASRDQVAFDNAFDVGLADADGHPSATSALNSADAVVLVGTDRRHARYCPESSTVVRIGTHAAVPYSHSANHFEFSGDIADTLKKLTMRLKQRHRSDHLDRALKLFASFRARDSLAQRGSPTSVAHPTEVIQAVSDLAESNSVFAADTGDLTTWISASLAMNGSRRLLSAHASGAASAALPLAIGAQSADVDRQVIALPDQSRINDSIDELVSLILQGLDVKIVVLAVDTPRRADLPMIARAFGAYARRVRDPLSITDALATAFDYDGPALVEIEVQRVDARLVRRRVAPHRARRREETTW